MYESSCSYQTALDLKRSSPIAQVRGFFLLLVFMVNRKSDRDI